MWLNYFFKTNYKLPGALASLKGIGKFISKVYSSMFNAGQGMRLFMKLKKKKKNEIHTV